MYRVSGWLGSSEACSCISAFPCSSLEASGKLMCSILLNFWETVQVSYSEFLLSWPSCQGSLLFISLPPPPNRSTDSVEHPQDGRNRRVAQKWIVCVYINTVYYPVVNLALSRELDGKLIYQANVWSMGIDVGPMGISGTHLTHGVWWMQDFLIVPHCLDKKLSLGL